MMPDGPRKSAKSKAVRPALLTACSFVFAIPFSASQSSVRTRPERNLHLFDHLFRQLPCDWLDRIAMPGRSLRRCMNREFFSASMLTTKSGSTPDGTEGSKGAVRCNHHRFGKPLLEQRQSLIQGRPGPNDYCERISRQISPFVGYPSFEVSAKVLEYLKLPLVADFISRFSRSESRIDLTDDHIEDGRVKFLRIAFSFSACFDYRLFVVLVSQQAPDRLRDRVDGISATGNGQGGEFPASMGSVSVGVDPQDPLGVSSSIPP